MNNWTAEDFKTPEAAQPEPRDWWQPVDINETIIRHTYASQHVELASYHPFFGRWSANSQYGYVLDWAADKETAERLALDHYRSRMHLIIQ